MQVERKSQSEENKSQSKEKCKREERCCRGHDTHNFKHKYVHASHHATSSCHVIIPHHHAMSACHVTMPHHHAISTCYVAMPHHHAMSTCHLIMTHYHATSLECTFWIPRGSLRECHVALQPKFSLLGPNFKTQYLLHLESVWHAVCTVGIILTSS